MPHSKHKLSATARVEVRFNDCDPLGIVWHGNYIKFLEDGREAFSKKYGFDYLSFYNKGFAAPIVHVSCDYRKSLKYRDVALIEATFKKTDAAKIIFDYVIRKESDGEIVCKGNTVQVFVHKDTMELSLTVPDFIDDWKKEVGLL